MLLDDFMDAHGVTHIFWSVASLRAVMPELQSLIPALIKATGVRATEMKPQEIANTIWACAALRVPRDQLMIALPLLSEVTSIN